MTLPTYEEAFEWMHGRGMEPWPPPDMKPTRTGLGRYLMKCAYESLFADMPYVCMMHRALEGGPCASQPCRDNLPEWDRIYRSCTWAYYAMLQHWHLRLPRDTFGFERAKVEELLLEDTFVFQRDEMLYRDQVMRWARR